MKRYFKCIDYNQGKERLFTVGNVYEVNADIMNFLSKCYKFEEVKKRHISEFVEKNIAVFFDNAEQERQFLKLCEDNSLRWCSGRCATEYEPTYAGFGKGGCSVAFGFAGKNGISFDRGSSYAKRGYDLINASEFLAERKPIPKSYKIVINCVDGKTTIAELYINGHVVKSINAKLNPEDKFNFQIGARTAFERLFEKKKTHDGCDGCIHFEKGKDHCKKLNCRGAYAPCENEGKPDMYKRK